MAARASLSDTLLTAPAARTRGSAALAARYAAFGLGALGVAALAHGSSWLLVWLGLSNLLLGYAYFGNRVAILGKRSDGSIAWLSLLLFLPYFTLVWAFHWLKLAGLRTEPCWHQAAPGLYLGRKPRRSELPPDCRLIVDLSAEHAETRDVVRACRYRCLPVLNRHVPGDAELNALLRELLDEERAIYVHCGAGRGRSAMLVAALLVLRGHAADVTAAERALQQIRPGVRLHRAQRALIARQCAALAPHAEARENLWPSASTKCA
jgi:hypothetical protein